MNQVSTAREVYDYFVPLAHMEIRQGCGNPLAPVPVLRVSATQGYALKHHNHTPRSAVSMSMTGGNRSPRLFFFTDIAVQGKVRQYQGSNKIRNL